MWQVVFHLKLIMSVRFINNTNTVIIQKWNIPSSPVLTYEAQLLEIRFI